MRQYYTVHIPLSLGTHPPCEDRWTTKRSYETHFILKVIAFARENGKRAAKRKFEVESALSEASNACFLKSCLFST